MTNVLLPFVGTLLAVFFCVFLTLHERSVTARRPEADDSPETSDQASAEAPAVMPADEPGPRDRCRCGHTYDWHHSCPRDVCGCLEFVHARAEAA